MTTFPALQPSGRTFTPGEYPNTPFRSWSGAEGRVRHSNVMLESALRLTFTGITEAQMLSILSHYQGQRGSFESFALPNDVWSGVTTVGDYSLTGYRWRYAGPPTVTDLPCGNHIVELSLATVLPEGVTLNGLNSLVALLINGGAAAASNGLNKTITWSLTPGVGSAITEASGMSITITASLAAGLATGTSGSDPDFASVALLLHMDGTNGSTTFTDSSTNNLSLTVNGSAAISTSQKKFGTGSLDLTGSGTNYLSYPSASGDELDVATNESVTVEFWAYVTAVDSGSSITSGTTMLELSGGSGSRFSLHMITVSGTETLYWSANYGGTSFDHQTGLTLNQWQHIAMVRDTNVWKLYLDGVESTSSSTDGAIITNDNFVIIGPRQNSAIKLYVDDLRYTVGVARYTAGFTPPTAAFPDS